MPTAISSVSPRAARQSGSNSPGVVEIAEGRAQTANERRREEGQKLQTQLQQGTALILLDERGKNFSSEDFAGRIGLLRDGGRKALVIAIGGADGHDQSLARPGGIDAVVRRADLAAPDGARHAGRAALPGGDDSVGASLSSLVKR